MSLIPINQLITIPEGVAITPEQLQLADLSTIPLGTILLTIVGSFKVSIRRNGEQLMIRSSYTVRGDDPLAKIYGVKNVAAAMDRATGLVPADQAKAAALPQLTSAGWTRPAEVYWEFRLPTTATGSKLLADVQSIGEFTVRTTRALLTAAGEAHPKEVTRQE